jgi:hypothetical protein
MDGWLHHAPAAFTLPLGLGMLLGVDLLLSRLIGRPVVAPSAARATPLPNLAGRLRPVILFFAGLFVVQVALSLHLRSAGRESFPLLRQGLAQTPLELAGWVGVDRPDLNRVVEKLPYTADDLLLRDYRRPGGGPPIQVYAAYSRQGEDRKHHPEVCIREVTGAPEDLDARARVGVDATGKRQVQRFVFRTDTVGKTTVYYWHYTFLPAEPGGFLKTLHQRLGQQAPSVTVQASVPTDDPAILKQLETEFLPAMDLALRQTIVPESAVMDATRLPIALLKE